MTTIMSILFTATMMVELLLLGQHSQAQELSPPMTKIGQQQRALQNEYSIDFDACFANLDLSNANIDGYLNQTEYLQFVQRAANGTLDNTWYGTPIDQFFLLPQEYINLYNLLACGNENIGCPTIEGIYIGGYQLLGAYIDAGIELSEQQYFKYSSLCKQYDTDITSSPTTTSSVVSTTPPSPTPVTLAPAIPMSSVPTPSHTMSPVIVDITDPPYSGTIVSTFTYEIYNTVSLNAQSIMTGTNPTNMAMDVLLQSTTDFVNDVVNNLEERIRGGGRGQTAGKGRKLDVALESDAAVSIDQIRDIICSQPVNVNSCQMITASAELTLTDEPRLTTELRMKNMISRALTDPGITIPGSSGLFYVGPIDPFDAIGIPPPDVTGPDGGEGKGPPSWVVPVSICAVNIGMIILLLLVGTQIRKRKRSRREPSSGDLKGDISGSYESDPEVFVGEQTEVSPFPDIDLESGKGKDSTPNPFLVSDSDSDSESDMHRKNEACINIDDMNDFNNRQRESSSDASSDTSSDTTEDIIDDDVSDGDVSKQAELKRMHLIAVEALVMEGTYMKVVRRSITLFQSLLTFCFLFSLTFSACPERANKIGDMMVEYDGREEELLNHLAMMIETKNRAAVDNDSRSSARDSLQSTEAGGVRNPYDDDDDSSSTTDWSSESSDDGFSSIDSTTLNKSDVEISTVDVLAAAEAKVVTDDLNSPKLSPSKEVPHVSDLDEAIQAGDWTAVGTTAALMATVATRRSERDEEEVDSIEDSMNASQNSYSTNERDQVAEFDQLVEQGDWEAIIAAASKFEDTASHLGSMNESRHSMDDSLTSLEESSSNLERKDVIDEIQALVREVMPDELENLHEMLLQYNGREEDLLETLRTMQERSNMVAEVGDDNN